MKECKNVPENVQKAVHMYMEAKKTDMELIREVEKVKRQTVMQM